MTFAEKLRAIAENARHSTEPGRAVEALANALAEQIELTAPNIEAAGSPGEPETVTENTAPVDQVAADPAASV